MPSALDDLLAVPVAALLAAPHRPDEVAEVLAADGIEVAPARLAQLLERMTALGLARVAGYDDAGAARYVATSLGQRAAAALLTADAELSVGLEELERLRTDLLATVGHDLRTPLTAIRTSVGLLLDPALEPTASQRQQLLTTIGRSADRMQRLLTQLLDLARLRAGRVEMDRTSFDARELVREVAAAIEPMAAARGQRLVLDVPPEPVEVAGDRRWLEQALLNIAANAQKFSPNGEEVRVGVAADGDTVRWWVTDRGPGIDAAAQARLFERFFVGAADRGGGVGIGLPTALGVAQAHGGTIEVDSEIGRGSSFTLVVPVGEGPA
ncbi:MAG TPA: HAMP domain-containing sensor histidine kinase [Candidatus Limnocylindria bacterium]|nr:HAMP domain-containing sensor histidine kinase [Candidatus Limnocylindria bacterium]